MFSNSRFLNIYTWDPIKKKWHQQQIKPWLRLGNYKNGHGQLKITINFS